MAPQKVGVEMAKKRVVKKPVVEVDADGNEIPVVKKKPAKRKTKKEAEADARVKLFWGVFSPTMKRVAVFHYHEKKLAAKKAKDLSDSKSPHFVAKIKEPVEESA